MNRKYILLHTQVQRKFLTISVFYPNHEIPAGVCDGFHHTAGILFDRCLCKQLSCRDQHGSAEKTRVCSILERGPKTPEQKMKIIQVACVCVCSPVFLSSSLMKAILPLAVIFILPLHAGSSSFQSAALTDANDEIAPVIQTTRGDRSKSF